MFIIKPMPADRTEPRCIWSIGIFTGDSPLRLSPPKKRSAPIPTAADIGDLPSSFVADPFMVRERGEWSMFFEIMSAEKGRGEIGLAKSRDGLAWRYHGSVLREPFHLSYPNVFEWQGDYFMIPETLSQGAIVLYRAFRFPFEWKPVARLMEGAFADATPFRFQDRWWLFACSTPYEHDTLRLFYSTDLTHGWTEHPSSPVIERNPSAARPGGRVVCFDGRLIRYAQDCARYYGHRLRAFEITRLSPENYEEHECSESPILATGKGWNSAGMHHADAHLIGPGNWLACVDGHRFDRGTTPFLSRLLKPLIR
jgi:hypothetical protein